MSDSKITGSCLCGNVRYETDEQPTFAVHCHCNDCKKSSGAGHISALFVPSDGFKVTGETTSYETIADSGDLLIRHFCPVCGARLFALSTKGSIGIMAGSLDDPELFQPRIEVYTKRRASWDRISHEIPGFNEMPPPKE